jgi:hypothetical protein
MEKFKSLKIDNKIIRFRKFLQFIESTQCSIHRLLSNYGISDDEETPDMGHKHMERDVGSGMTCSRGDVVGRYGPH